MDKNAIKIRIGKGSFNDIVIDDENVLQEHCNIVHDENGLRVVNLHKNAETYVNGDKIFWEAKLSSDDELRVGSTIVNWKEEYLSKKSEQESNETVAEIIKEIKKEKAKEEIFSSLFSILLYAVYFVLAGFAFYAFFESHSIFLKILSACLFVGFIVFNIISNNKYKKELSEEELADYKKERRTRIIIVFLLVLVFSLTTVFKTRKYIKPLPKVVTVDLIVSNDCNQDVYMSYKLRNNDSIISHMIAPEQSITIGWECETETGNLNRWVMGVKRWEYCTFTFNDSLSIKHEKDSNGYYIPQKHNFLLRSSWTRVDTTLVYTITPDDYEMLSLNQGSGRTLESIKVTAE